MTDRPLDPGLAERLRELADARVRSQIAAARQRADQRRQDRHQFLERRRAGLATRHAIKQARQTAQQPDDH